LTAVLKDFTMQTGRISFHPEPVLFPKENKQLQHPERKTFRMEAN